MTPLADVDKARLAETRRLQQTAGEAVWPGFGQQAVPVLLWHGSAPFSSTLAEPPGAWQLSGDTFDGEPYYWREPDNEQNFAVEVDGRWVASMATKWEADAFLREQFEANLPAPLGQLIPYRLLIMPSEVQMTGLLHEMFHVYQAERAPARLAAAEAAHALEGLYWQMEPAMREAWLAETAILRDALTVTSDAESKRLAQEFLELRQERRRIHSLPDTLVAFERHLEWEEGLAKYIELAAWREAAAESAPAPLAELSELDNAFRGYQTFEDQWSRELDTMQRQGEQESIVRFYYSGMALAMLLDRHRPGWQDDVWADDVWLETLLQTAVAP